MCRYVSPSENQQLRLAARAGITANGRLETHGRRFGVVAAKVEPGHVDLVVDEPLHHLFSQPLGLFRVGRGRELLEKVVELPLRVHHRGLIFFVRRRQQPDVLRHVLHVALADAEGDIAVLDLLVRGVQAGEALVAVDRFRVVPARELAVRQGQLGQNGVLRERVLLFHELEILLAPRDNSRP